MTSNGQAQDFYVECLDVDDSLVAVYGPYAEEVAIYLIDGQEGNLLMGDGVADLVAARRPEGYPPDVFVNGPEVIRPLFPDDLLTS